MRHNASKLDDYSRAASVSPRRFSISALRPTLVHRGGHFGGPARTTADESADVFHRGGAEIAETRRFWIALRAAEVCPQPWRGWSMRTVHEPQLSASC